MSKNTSTSHREETVVEVGGLPLTWGGRVMLGQKIWLAQTTS